MLAGHVGESYMPNLALFPELGQYSHGSLEGDVVIGDMELIDIDAANPQALQAALHCFGKMLWARIVRPLPGAWPLPSTLSGDHQTSRIGIERLGNQFLGHIGAIGIGSVDQIHVEL